MSLESRFWENVIPEPNSGCWLWMGALGNSFGHGQLRPEGPGHSILAHRLSLIIAGREIPKGMFVLHHCDNPACVNPDHLYVGTQKDNIRDTVRRKRHLHARKTHCKHGHPLSGRNLGKSTKGRRCLECHRIDARNRKTGKP